MVIHSNKTIKERKENRITRVIISIFIFTMLSGSIRKWALESNTVGNIILAIQLVSLFSFLLIKKQFKSPFTRLLWVYLLLLVVLALNPMNLTIYHGLVGIVIHFNFWCAIFFYFRNREYFEIKSYTYFFLFFGIGELVLAYIQYTLPTTHVLNKYATESAVTFIAEIGDATRVTGTFSYLSGFSSFLLFYPLFLWGLVRLRFPLYLLISLYVAGLVGCFTSGARTSTYLYLLLVALTLIYEIKVKRIFILLTYVGILVGILFVTMSVFQSRVRFLTELIDKSYENFLERRRFNVSRGEENDRIKDPVEEVIFFRGEYPMIGIGLGATYQGATSLWGFSKYALEYKGGYEEEGERVMLEGGVILFLFRLLLFAYIYRHSRVPKIALLVLFFLCLFYVPIIFNVYNGVFLFLGLVFLDRSYDISEQQLALDTKRLATKT